MEIAMYCLLLTLILFTTETVNVQCQTIITPPESTAGRVGDSVQFTCEVEQGFTWFMSWNHNNYVIYSYQNGTESYPKSTDKYEVKHKDGEIFTLTINQLKYSDGGLIQCKVTGQSVDGNLIVVGKPELSASAPKLVEGTIVIYTCSATFAGLDKNDTSNKCYPKMTVTCGDKLLTDQLHQQDPERSSDYYVIQQEHSMTLSANMENKFVICEVSSCEGLTPLTDIRIVHVLSSAASEKHQKRLLSTLETPRNPPMYNRRTLINDHEARTYEAWKTWLVITLPLCFVVSLAIALTYKARIKKLSRPDDMKEPLIKPNTSSNPVAPAEENVIPLLDEHHFKQQTSSEIPLLSA